MFSLEDIHFSRFNPLREKKIRKLISDATSNNVLQFKDKPSFRTWNVKLFIFLIFKVKQRKTNKKRKIHTRVRARTHTNTHTLYVYMCVCVCACVRAFVCI